VKFHISHTGVPYDDPRYHEIYAKASEYQVPILAHAFSPGTVRAFLKAAKIFPDVPFIVGHSGGYQWSDCIDDIAAVPNAYFDLCCSCVDAGRVEAFVAAAGAQRVLLGTDLPFHAPALELSKLLYSRITRQEKAFILGGNIRRILGDRL
jgi:predicted TIM-barrel fold metal-dependent hydrolase